MQALMGSKKLQGRISPKCLRVGIKTMCHGMNWSCLNLVKKMSPSGTFNSEIQLETRYSDVRDSTFQEQNFRDGASQEQSLYDHNSQEQIADRL